MIRYFLIAATPARVKFNQVSTVPRVICRSVIFDDQRGNAEAITPGHSTSRIARGSWGREQLHRCGVLSGINTKRAEVSGPTGKVPEAAMFPYQCLPVSGGLQMAPGG